MSGYLMDDMGLVAWETRDGQQVWRARLYGDDSYVEFIGARDADMFTLRLLAWRAFEAKGVRRPRLDHVCPPDATPMTPTMPWTTDAGVAALKDAIAKTVHATRPAGPQADAAYISEHPTPNHLTLNVYNGDHWLRFDVSLDVRPILGQRKDTP